MASTIEKHEFQAEARQLLELMIHSVYSNKEIFLRELISNASDALDKLRFAAVTEPALAEGHALEIRLIPDAEAKTLTLWDSGIGMSRDELVKNLGTIAHSGTKAFLAANAGGSGDLNLIGQFGVGFYSTFLVSDRVVLITRKAGEEDATRWESTGDGTYTLEDAERTEVGTTITLHLKAADPEDGLEDFTSEWKIKEIVKQYSDFVTYPIRMKVGEKDQTLNSMKAIWTRDASDVKPEEYDEFYHHISHDLGDPLEVVRFRGEGTFEYTMLLFLPSRAPFDLFYPEMKRGVHLYVKRVFIMDDCRDLVPDYLRFVRGVVDSEDLSLNISREILQQDRQITLMRKRLEKKVLGTLEELKEAWRKASDGAATAESVAADSQAVDEAETAGDTDGGAKADADSTDGSGDTTAETPKFLTFWNEFGKVLKEGAYRGGEHQERILSLCLVASTHGPGYTTLADYVGRMKEGQEKIYYLTGDRRELLEQSPHLESYRAKGYEVLLLTDPVDELWVNAPGLQFQEHEFESAARGTAELGTAEERRQAAEALSGKRKEHASLMEALQERLSDSIKEVRLSNRLTESLACLVAGNDDLSPQMEHILRAMGQDPGKQQRILELNPNHPALTTLQHLFDRDPRDSRIGDYAELIYGQAILAEGGRLEDPARFSKLFSTLLTESLGRAESDA
ncbi:MAG: molecular chaperone HtpG [Candidatus Eisenbacteria bacterium]|uniref:Chaperone protein HtpG n=1 Tax=Eiseniibacteriota bacterium TaxID=2212470 RepID=A0A956LX96_UNCEI|nr:molecular chaperone HtpG [Candidatus Eisenbacteria bacterium]